VVIVIATQPKENIMTQDSLFFENLLDSLKQQFVFVDTDHVIRYMNRTAIKRHKGSDLIGTSIFDCHNEISNEIIVEIFGKMQEGLEEEMFTDNAKHRIYMRAVRDRDGALMGYYERYEPPKGA
jgi:DUF438 domain-containing protein